LPAHVASPDLRVSHREWIGGAVKTLVVLCCGDWPSDERLEGEMYFMWANTLEGFTQETIQAAIDEFVRAETVRPTPARLHKLCVKHAPRPPVEVYEPKNPEPPSDEERQRIRALTGQAFPELRRMCEAPAERHPIHSGLE
jgi:hypothetical protein